MHILFTTYGLLLIMALFAFAQWKSVESLLSTDALVKWRFGYARERMCATLQKQSKGLHNAYVKQNASKDDKAQVLEEDDEDEEESRELLLPDSANEAESTSSKGKRSHLLDVSTLFRDKDISKVEGRGKVAFQILRNLIECLYTKEPFYQKMKEKDPDFTEHFIEWLMQKAKVELEEKRALKRAKELAVLDLDDESLKEARFKIFNGTQSINDSGNTSLGYYPLYELISVQKKQHLVSLWLAPKPLLYAVFQNEDAVAELCELRMNMYRERKRTKAKSDMQSLDDINKQKLEQFFKSYPSEFIDSQYFDYLRTDIFALGCVFYKILYQKKPCWMHPKRLKNQHVSLSKRQMSFKRTIERFRSKRAKQLQSACKGSKKRFSPQCVEQIILKMIHPNPFSRPTASDVRASLL